MARTTRGAGKAGPQRQRLVVTRVATLPVGRYTDPGQTGLQLDVRPRYGGLSRTWLLRYKFRGEETRILLGHFPQTTLDAARGLARHYRELASQGVDPRRARPRRLQRASPQSLSSAVAAPGAKHTIEYLVSEFTERYLRPTRKRPEYAEQILAKDVLPEWKGRDARTIEPGEVISLLDRIVDRGSPVQANRTAAIVGQLFKFGIHRRIVATTPVQLLYRPGGKEKARERVLTDEELRAFLADPKKCTRFDRLAHVMLVLLLTGQRRGELTLARWVDIDLEARTWSIPDENAKSGRGHVVPLTDWAVAELRALKALAKRSPWVLPGKDDAEHVDPKQLTRALAKCLQRFQAQGIAAFTLHDLRRTMRTGLARLKVEPHIAERVLNHAQETIAGTYDRHAYMDEKRAALEKWAAHLQGLIDTGPGSLPRGRPRKFRGVKDHKNLPAALRAELPAVVDFIMAWRAAKLRPAAGDVSAYQQALRDTAAKYNRAPSTLERTYRTLRWLAEPLAEAKLAGQDVVLQIESFLP